MTRCSLMRKYPLLRTAYCHSTGQYNKTVLASETQAVLYQIAWHRKPQGHKLYIRLALNFSSKSFKSFPCASTARWCVELCWFLYASRYNVIDNNSLCSAYRDTYCNYSAHFIFSSENQEVFEWQVQRTLRVHIFAQTHKISYSKK